MYFKRGLILGIGLYLLLLGSVPLISATPTYVVKITSTSSNYMITINYNDSSNQFQRYLKGFEHGNQTYTINGEITYVWVSGSGDPQTTMQIIRGNQVLITKTGSDFSWDAVKEPLPPASVLDQIPAYPNLSVIVGLMVGTGIFFKRNQRNK